VQLKAALVRSVRSRRDRVKGKLMNKKAKRPRPKEIGVVLIGDASVNGHGVEDDPYIAKGGDMPDS
jgi:hypothetical protein